MNNKRRELIVRAGAFALGFWVGMKAATAVITTAYPVLARQLPEITASPFDPLALMHESAMLIFSPVGLLTVMSLYLLVFLSSLMVLFFPLLADYCVCMFLQVGSGESPKRLEP